MKKQIDWKEMWEWVIVIGFFIFLLVLGFLAGSYVFPHIPEEDAESQTSITFGQKWELDDRVAAMEERQKIIDNTFEQEGYVQWKPTVREVLLEAAKTVSSTSYDVDYIRVEPQTYLTKDPKKVEWVKLGCFRFESGLYVWAHGVTEFNEAIKYGYNSPEQKKYTKDSKKCRLLAEDLGL